MSKVPIIILTWNKTEQAKDSIGSFINHTNENCYDIVICDNYSTQPSMIKYLDELEKKYVVIRHESNLIHKGWKAGIEFACEKYGKDTYFIISDPDILLYPAIPKDWPFVLRDFLENSPEVSKIGLALDISYLPKESGYRKLESGFWVSYPTDKISDPCYNAQVASTTVLLRHNTYRDDIYATQFNWHSWDGDLFKVSLRIGGRFLCRHLGWEMREKYPTDFNYLDELWKSGKRVQSYAYHQEADHPNIYSGWK